MKNRHKRLIFVLAGLAGLAVAATLVFKALDSNLSYFFSPTEVAAGSAPKDSVFRLGGIVEVGSVQQTGEGLTVHFSVTDNANSIMISYTGILPDLFEEGQGVITQGKLGEGGLFYADEVLAKHDETYMPPEVADALEESKKKLESNDL
ncbi:MAG: cytochrome c maturation protein CcmE [Gammaproteobacteria bacterium]|nr:cytochrome c maturation protein CcmE [Gammaproteobacteria bacterium]